MRPPRFSILQLIQQFSGERLGRSSGWMEWGKAMHNFNFIYKRLGFSGHFIEA